MESTRSEERKEEVEKSYGRCPACGCIGPNPGYDALSSEEATVEFSKLRPGLWSFDEERKALTREFTLRNFAAAIDFINNAALVAEREDIRHHPDIHLFEYRKLRVRLSTHAAGGLTIYDFKLAHALDEIKIDYSPKWLKSHPELQETAMTTSSGDV
jgi:4a-hydroxytetrahydrobiopterin dehydratase